MIITVENKIRYKRLGIDVGKLKLYYVERAKELLGFLQPYNDAYAVELKEALKSFIEKPSKDLIDVIYETESPVEWYNSFSINDTLFDICYPEPEWM